VANYFKVHGWQPGAAVMLPAHASAQHDKALLNKINKPTSSLVQLRTAGFSSMLPYSNSEDKAVPLTFEVEQGQEFWLGLQNFYVITRYNRSPLYARAVWELSEAIKTRRQAAVTTDLNI
jgi:membrane-bound lytic murein transglycosylase B